MNPWVAKPSEILQHSPTERPGWKTLLQNLYHMFNASEGKRYYMNAFRQLRMMNMLNFSQDRYWAPWTFLVLIAGYFLCKVC